MPKPAARFDVESVRASRDDAADVYAPRQSTLMPASLMNAP